MKPRTKMRRSPPSTQETTTTASRDAVNTHMKTYLEFYGMAHNCYYSCCIVVAFVTHNHCSWSQNTQMDIWKTNDTWGMSCSILMEFITGSTWGSQVHIMHNKKKKNSVYSPFANITHWPLPTWTRYEEKQNHLNSRTVFCTKRLK